MATKRAASEGGPCRLRTWTSGLGAALLLAGTLVLATPDLALACSCVEPVPPRAALGEADAVFAGEVVRVRGARLFSGDTIEATVQVRQTWKGPVRPRLAVATASDGAACGFPFERGQEVLVYAYEDDDALATDICTRTERLHSARRDLAALGKGTVPPADPLPVRALQLFMDRPLTAGLALVILAAAAWWLVRRIRRPDAT